MNEVLATTHGILHAGFSGLRTFVARKKGRYKLIGNRFVIPHDTIPSTVTTPHIRTSRIDLKLNYLFLQFLLNPFTNVKWDAKMS